MTCTCMQFCRPVHAETHYTVSCGMSEAIFCKFIYGNLLLHITNLHLLRVELRSKLPGKLHRVTGPLAS